MSPPRINVTRIKSRRINVIPSEARDLPRWLPETTGKIPRFARDDRGYRLASA